MTWRMAWRGMAWHGMAWHGAAALHSPSMRLHHPARAPASHSSAPTLLHFLPCSQLEGEVETPKERLARLRAAAQRMEAVTARAGRITQVNASICVDTGSQLGESLAQPTCSTEGQRQPFAAGRKLSHGCLRMLGMGIGGADMPLPGACLLGPYHLLGACHAMPCRPLHCWPVPCHAMPCHAMFMHTYCWPPCLLHIPRKPLHASIMQTLITTIGRPAHAHCWGSRAPSGPAAAASGRRAGHGGTACRAGHPRGSPCCGTW